MTAEGSDNEEAFVGLAEGQLEEGAQVLADLEGNAEGQFTRSIPHNLHLHCRCCCQCTGNQLARLWLL